MKTVKIIIVAFLALTLGLKSYAQMQDHSKMASTKTETLKVSGFSHKDIVILEHQYQLAAATKTEMEQVFDAYLQIKDAFVKDDEQATEKATMLMAEKVPAVVPTKLEGEGLKARHNHQEVY